MTIELRGINEMLSVGIKIVNTTGQDYLLLNCLPSLSSFINTVPCPLRPSNATYLVGKDRNSTEQVELVPPESFNITNSTGMKKNSADCPTSITGKFQQCKSVSLGPRSEGDRETKMIQKQLRSTTSFVYTQWCKQA